MTINYYSLGSDKRLCDIIIAGSHDAGITSGAENAKTQSVGIYLQAVSGVRIFDLRVIAAKAGTDANGRKQVAFRAYHADEKLISHKKKTRTLAETGEQHQLTYTKLRAGQLGESLVDMLTDARKFVETNTTEFLILKFDKCKNWDYIACYCQELLGDKLYTDGGDINIKSLFQLKGKVIVLFSESGLQEVQNKAGIFSWRSLKGKSRMFRSNIPDKPYTTPYDGLQYYGKGGTNPFSGGNFSSKTKQNIKKQGKNLSKMAGNEMDYGSWVIGMMYWTSTGLFQSIKDRNDFMWTEPGKRQLLSLFEGGLGESIQGRFERRHLHGTNYASGAILRTFLPNIVMIDFADLNKCQFIFDLNKVADTWLVDGYSQYVASA
ncbi:hypothetical protein [Colwellia sp. MEBiC06753]